MQPGFIQCSMIFSGFYWCMSIVDESVCRMCVVFALKFIYLTQITLYNVLQFNSHDISRERHMHSLTHFGIRKRLSERLSTICSCRKDVRHLLRCGCARANERAHPRIVKCSFCNLSPCEHWHMWQNAVNTFAVSVLWFLVNMTVLLGWMEFYRQLLWFDRKSQTCPVRQYDNNRR